MDCGMHWCMRAAAHTQSRHVHTVGPRQFRYRAAPVTTTSLSESMPAICIQASLRSAAGHPGHMMRRSCTCRERDMECACDPSVEL